ncbi:uncharacterized protein LOC142336613 [Convolutriloba macropyga]|uniref:uncharacterized protein LOC142336613 n=1 Tax=Convolutriloba macropyga TaxID=536237 RepID=UPI003F52278B
MNKLFRAVGNYPYGGWKKKHNVPPPGYLGGLPELLWTVPNFDNWSTWQVDATKDLSGERSSLANAFNACHFQVVFNSDAYQNKEETRVVIVEAPKLAISLVLTMVMVILVCVHCRSFKYSRILMALTSIGLSLLALIGGISFGVVVGLKMIPLVLIVAYLILGTGMDSGFLLLHEWCLTASKIDYEKSTATEFMVITARGCMLSVTLADWTAIAAFTCGSFTPFQAVNLCSGYLALAIAFLWFGEVFFYLPILCLQTRKLYPKEKRKTDKLTDFAQPGPGPAEKLISDKTDTTLPEGRYVNYRHAMAHEDHMTERGDLVGDKRAKWGYIEPEDASTGYYSEVTDSSYSETQKAKKKEDKKRKPVTVFNCYEKFVMKTFVDFTFAHPMRYMWMLSFLLMSVFYVSALVTMDTREDVSLYFLDDSLSKLYIATFQEYVPEGPWFWTIIMLSNPIVNSGREITSDPGFIKEMEDLNKTLTESAYFTDAKFPVCFLDYVRDPMRVKGGEFNLTYQCRSGSTKYAMGILQNRKEWRIKEIEFRLKRKSSRMLDVREECKVLDQIDKVEDQFSQLDLEFTDWMYGVMLRDCILCRALWISVLQATACCIVMVTLFVPEPVVIVATVLMTCLTLASILGCWWLVAHLTYNSSTFIVCLVATGMCIDYTAHGGHAFYIAWRDHEDRVKREKEEERDRRRALNGYGYDKETETAKQQRDQEMEEDLRREKTISDAILKDTMELISVPLLNSAVSSALGMAVILLAAQCQSFREVGFATIVVFIFSMINGAIMLPVCLSYTVLMIECVKELKRQRRNWKREKDSQKRQK